MQWSSWKCGHCGEKRRMRITLKKVIVYIFSVCVVDSIILCIYVSSNHEKRTEFFQRVAGDSSLADQPDAKNYFVNNEPHFERLIKEYRSQEEYPKRVFSQNDRNEDEKGLRTNDFNNIVDSSRKLNSDIRPEGIDRAKVQHRVEFDNNHRPSEIPPTKGHNKVGSTKTNRSEFSLVEPQSSRNLVNAVNIQYNEEQRLSPLEILKEAESRQNKPIYVNYVQLPDNQLQPVQVVHPESVKLNGQQKRNVVPFLAYSPPRSSASKSSTEVNLNDVFLAVKTTQKYHRSRLQVLLDTWVSVSPQEIYFFTDADDEEFQQKTNGHMINTRCPSRHVRSALCCKMTVMFDSFMNSNKSWFCHVDDDNYLNLKELRKLLDLYQPERQDVYLGRSSTTYPIKTYSTQNPMQIYQFWFATGGAGVCISRALAKKMVPYISGGRMLSTCESIRMPDDVTIGYINEVLLNVPMVHIKQMNSHLQELWSIRQNDIKNQITLSYRMDNMNKITLNNPAFTMKDDPTRFKSIHCMLYPNSTICPDWFRG